MTANKPAPEADRVEIARMPLIATSSDASLPIAPILMRKDDIILMKRAADHSGKTEKTIRSWCKQFGIGRKSCRGAPIEISAPALEMVLEGDIVALELLRDGKRTHPRVRRYFDHLGIPV